VYSRADLSRTVAVVAVLFLTAISASAVAREFRTADTQNENHPAVRALNYMGRLIAERSGGRYQIRMFHSRELSSEDRKIFRGAAIQSSRFMREKWSALEEESRQQAKAAGATIVTDIDRKPFEAAMAGIYAKAQRDPAAAELIERIRKVE
jgi:TRAP-type C4-dicarboxylate transport system substrate-binding protein